MSSPSVSGKDYLRQKLAEARLSSGAPPPPFPSTSSPASPHLSREQQRDRLRALTERTKSNRSRLDKEPPPQLVVPAPVTTPSPRLVERGPPRLPFDVRGNEHAVTPTQPHSVSISAASPERPLSISDIRNKRSGQPAMLSPSGLHHAPDKETRLQWAADFGTNIDQDVLHQADAATTASQDEFWREATSLVALEQAKRRLGRRLEEELTARREIDGKVAAAQKELGMFRARCEQLKAESSTRLAAEVAKLQEEKKELETLDQQVSQLTSTLAYQRDDTEGAILRAVKQRQAAEARREEVEQTMQRKLDDLFLAKADVESRLQAQRDRRERVNREWSAKLARQEADIRELRQMKATVEVKLEEEVRKWEAEIGVLRQSHERDQERSGDEAALRRAVATKESEIAALRQQLMSAEAESAETAAEIAAAVALVNADRDTLQRDLDATIERAVEAEAQLKAKELELEDLKRLCGSGVQYCDEELAALEKEEAAWKAQLEGQRRLGLAKLDDQQRDIDNLNHQIATQQQRLHQLTAAAEEKRRAEELATMEMLEKAAEADAAATAIERETDTLRELQRVELERVRASSAAADDASHRQLKTLEEMIEALTVEEREIALAIQVRRDEMKVMAAQVAQAEDSHRKAEEERENAKKEAQRVTSELIRLRGTLDKIRSRVSEEESTKLDDKAQKQRIKEMQQQEAAYLAGVLRCQSFIRKWNNQRKFRRIVDELVRSPQAAKYKKRGELVRELVKSEESYVKLLQLGAETFHQPIREARSKGQPVIGDEAMERAVFQTLSWSSVQAATEELATLLRHTVDSSWPLVPVGPVFLSSMTKLREVLEPYMRVLPKALASLATLKTSDPSFVAFLKQAESSPLVAATRRDLQLFLLLPTQRAAQYIAALQELARLSDGCVLFDKDQHDITIAVDQIVSLDLITFLSVDGQPSGSSTLQMQGPLTQVVGTRRGERMCFLFPSLLVFATEQRGRLVTLDAFPTSALALQDAPPGAGDGKVKNAFILSYCGDQRVFLLSASSPQEKTNWWKALEQVCGGV